MIGKYVCLFISMFVCSFPQWSLRGQEQIFAAYFDIPVNSQEETEVIGRIHLERNKDVLLRPIPEKYHFEIVKQDEQALFQLDTRYDLSNRIMGVLTVAKGKVTGNSPSVYRMTIALKEDAKLLETFEIDVRIVEKTLWSIFNERYTPATLNNNRLYGRMKYSDEEISAKILELKRNNGQFEGYRSYTAHPQEYKGVFDSKNAYLPTGTIEYDWVEIANKIGGLGYAYATSTVYGPQGVPEKRKALREALFQAILVYTKSVSIEGSDILIDGKPIGNCTGDGFTLLLEHELAGPQILTHQWTMTDPLVVPSLYLMSDILEGIKKQDPTCLEVHDALIRYYQIFMSIIKDRRAIDNPEERWGEIQDTLYSSGAWADANLGHRSRTMLALPIIWADYNRPMTYVQYWYSDFYHDKPFKDFSFSPGWSPHGIAADVSHWMTKYDVPAHKYIQSGFQPDGTVSHHIANATDLAMVAYGFEWLTDCNNGYGYFKDTEFRLDSKYYQFQLDRLLRVYPKLFYKQRMDFQASGRSFHEDLKPFVTKTYIKAVNALLKARSEDTKLTGVKQLKDICRRLKANTYECSGTDAYWVNEYLVHRRGESEKPFFASLKLKSERTVGAEDFNKAVRRSWHLGYGILQLKIQGDEYSEQVLKNYDWHAVPGLTEEWRTDPMPLGHAQASLPGLNKISGVLADGKSGMGIYHHLPKETYSSATANKSYHFIEDKIAALGSGIDRLRTGRKQEIVTFIDQSVLKSKLSICIDGKVKSIQPGESVDLIESINNLCWLHQGSKGYIIIPTGKQQLLIKTGKEVNITDPGVADNTPNFIIALNHGVYPGEVWDNGYIYYLLPNVTKGEMSAKVKALQKDIVYKQNEAAGHAIYSAVDKTWQYAFFKPGTLSVGKIEITSEDVAMVMLRDDGDSWTLSAGNPMPDGIKQTMTFYLSASLPEGVYTYRTRGIYPQDGETVTITSTPKGSKVVVELPDIRDEVHYNYQSDLYAATPIVINIPK
jgi:Polysaccharide lyase family 8, C-terminal beta-sandwich domain./Polysaccharide lyase family 8, super-sandwich domain.